jgi:hypothetical protein
MGIDLAVRGADGQYVEVQVKSGGGVSGRDSRRFHVQRLRLRANLFIVGITYEGDDLVEAWVPPSGVFDRYTEGSWQAGKKPGPG